MPAFDPKLEPRPPKPKSPNRRSMSLMKRRMNENGELPYWPDEVGRCISPFLLGSSERPPSLLFWFCCCGLFWLRTSAMGTLLGSRGARLLRGPTRGCKRGTERGPADAHACASNAVRARHDPGKMPQRA